MKGWACDVAKGHCTCSPVPEVCNGIDDDCDGIVDNNAASSDCNSQMVGAICSDGSCWCPGYQNTCGNVCTDQASDPANCGGCGHACAANEICTEYVCEKPSCKGALKCNGESCCTTLPVPGGTFPMGRSLNGTDAYTFTPWAESAFQDEMPEHAASVSPYNLDRYKVTVGRMRNFVAAYDTWRASGHPKVGEGAHPGILGTGWESSWTLPQDAATLVGGLLCMVQDITSSNLVSLGTWTDSPSSQEDFPSECVEWPTAFAFCLWDGGRLPTEAEWEFAAAGGDENRLFPWGGKDGTADTAPDTCPIEAVCNYTNVGSVPAGNGRFGQADLAGNAAEWVFDGFGTDWYSNGGTACNDCVDLMTAMVA